MKTYNIAVVGATGAVGEEIIHLLEERNFPINRLIPLASSRSLGKSVDFKSQEIPVQALTQEVFKENEVEIAFFSAGGSVSKEFAPHAASAGAVVIDNTSHFRMQENVPLIVPEVNPSDITQWKQTGIISNPNCSTIQMTQVLKPLHDRYTIKRVDVSTYQAVSGAGKRGMEELVVQMQHFFDFTLQECTPSVFPHHIALNVIPHIDVFYENGYTKEELKMIHETHKIMHADFPISATCVRVPVLRSHSEAISVCLGDEPQLEEVRNLLAQAPSLKVIDDTSKAQYPMPTLATDTDETYVGRIRKDLFNPCVLHLWCVADQIRVGAATNAIRIAENWIKL